MRRVPKSGPALSFKPDDAVTFKHAKSENGVEVLQDTIEITNSSSRTVHFLFADDPEFKFSSHAGCIAPQSKTVVIATFFNVDGHCQPRKSSVVLRSIRVRSEDQQEVERLWKRTPTELIREKRWKLRFEKGQPLDTAPSTMPCTRREPLSSNATTGAGDGNWIANTAKTGKSRLPAATLAAECGNWLLRFQLQFAVIVMGAVVLSAYHSWGIAKSRPAPDTPDSAHTWMSHGAEANKSSLPAATEATECARWLVLTELLLTVAVVMDAYLVLRLVKSKKAPDVPDAPSLTDRWIANTAKTGKSRLPAATLAAECGNWLLRFQLQFAVIVMGAVVLSAYYSWGIAKSRHAPDTPDSAHTRMSHSAEANKSSLPAATEATECARWLVLTELLLTVAVVMDAYLALRLVKSKRAPDGPDAPSLTDRSCSKTSLAASILPKRYKRLHGWLSTSWATYAANTSKSWLSAATRAVQCARRPLRSRRLLAVVVMCAVVPTAYHELWVAKSKHVQDAPDSAHTDLSRTSSSCAFWTLDNVRKDMWVKYGAPATKLRLAAVTRALKYAGWFLRSQLLWAIIVMVPVVLTACYALWVLKHRHVPHSEDCVTIGGKTYCF